MVVVVVNSVVVVVGVVVVVVGVVVVVVASVVVVLVVVVVAAVVVKFTQSPDTTNTNLQIQIIQKRAISQYKECAIYK